MRIHELCQVPVRRTYRLNPRRLEQGVVTLLTSIVILLLATVFVVAVSKTSLMELRISANEIRARQAAAAAEAGLGLGAAYLSGGTPKGADKDGNGGADEITTPTVLSMAGNSKYSVAFCDPTQAVNAITCPASPGPVTCTRAPELYFRSPLLVACGWSDDSLGRAMVSQGIGVVQGVSNAPTNPLTTKGAVNVTGSASVINQYNNLTIWTGQDLNVTSATGKTFVRNPALAPLPITTPPPARTALPSSCQNPGSDFVCTTNSTSTGPDVIDLDPTLSNLSNADLFKNYFGVANVTEFQTQKATMPGIDPTDSAAISNLAGKTGEIFVINGNLTSMPNATIGSRDQPVVMIVDGDWSGAGNTLIYGIVFVTGNMNLTGSVDIYGAAVVLGTVQGTGGLNIVFDPAAAANTVDKIGKPGTIPGSWRDWRF